MAIKYKSTVSNSPPKFAQIGSFGWKRNHLATPIQEVARLLRKPVDPFRKPVDPFQDVSRALEASLMESQLGGGKRKRAETWTDPLNPHDRERDGTVRHLFLTNWPQGPML
jgi:hypothetical protein